RADRGGGARAGYEDSLRSARLARLSGNAHVAAISAASATILLASLPASVVRAHRRVHGSRTIARRSTVVFRALFALLRTHLHSSANYIGSVLRYTRIRVFRLRAGSAASGAPGAFRAWTAAAAT